MSTYLRDYANEVHLAKSGNQAAGTTGNTAGSSVDNIHDEGQMHAVQIVGTVVGTGPILAGKIQESADASTWSDITGATFNNVTASDDLQIINFLRSQRYTRYYGTETGTGSLAMPYVCLIGSQKKQL